jgi:hypothetical protein
MAEAEGFEPPIPFQVRQFSRLEPSTTRPRFRFSMINHSEKPRQNRGLFCWEAVPIQHLLTHSRIQTRVLGGDTMTGNRIEMAMIPAMMCSPPE